jgi:hypothetical protein
VPSDVAWIVPTHRPHFPFALSLLDGVREHGLDVDLHFVLGDRAEADEFDALLADGAHQASACSLVAIDEHLPAGRFQSYLAVGSIINAKKFVALHVLRDRYELLCTLDSETTVLAPGDVRRSHALRAERRAYPAHAVELPEMRQIVEASARLLGLRIEERILREVTGGGRLYAWFENVPVYERDALGEMFERLGAERDVTYLCDRLSWFDFDHILYQYFCCCFRGWHLDDLGWTPPETQGAWWELWSADVPEHRAMASELAASWEPSWVRDPALTGAVPSAFLAYHADRAVSA